MAAGIAAAAGALAGFAASLVPGVHVNALAALALAAVAAGVVDPGPDAALALVAAFAAAALAAPVAGAFLAAATDESAAGALPAHALLADGRGAEAADLGALGTFLGLAAGLALAAALRPVLGPPLDAFRWIELASPVLLLAVAVALVARERRAWPSAFAVLALTGALGWLAFRLGARSPLGLPASPLLPLLAGLFGAPPLLATLAARGTRRHRAQVRGRASEPWPRVARAVLAGATPGAAIGLLPAITPSVAGAAGLAALPAARREETLVALGAANGAGVAFSLLAFTTLDRPRSGALAAAGALDPARPFLLYAAVALAAALAGYFLARAAALALARVHARVPERAFAAAVLALLAAATWAFTGVLGLVELATAAALGLLPGAWGVRRSLAMGVVLVPVLLRLWT